MSTKRKALSLAKPVVKPSAKVATKSKIDETRTAVSTGPAPKSATKAAPETIEISSDSSSHYSDSDNEEDVNSDNEEAVDAAPEKKQQTSEPVAQQDEEKNDDDDDDDASPTFGDLARGNATIDVASALAAQQEASAAAANNASSTKNTITVQRPNGTTTISATSLGTVLNQALRTDDSDLLESCLQTSDPKIITNTITRMDSALAGVLLSKLAARMHRRPGRAFGLMKWIQTTLVAHGGSLVAQPEVVARLGELNRVLEERARGLPALLALKGKLDMLDQQMRWRKFVKQGGAKEEHEGSEEEEEEEEGDVDEPGMVYVEGDEEAEGKGTSNGAAAAAEEDFALIDVGADGESDEEEGDEDDEDEEDDEEFDDGESLDEDEVDHDDVEESGDEDEEDDEEDDEEEDAPPAKVQKTSSKFAKRK